MTPHSHLRAIALAAKRWSTGRWFVFHNPRAPHVPIEIRQGTPEGGPAASDRTWQESPCDECGGNHVNGGDRWHVAELTKVSSRRFGCGRKGRADADQSALDEANHIAACSPSAVLALLDELERVKAGLLEACDGWADRDTDRFDVDERVALRALAGEP